MKTKYFVPVLLLTGMTAFGNVAMADDELAGALLGAGAGAIIGDSINPRDGAIVGGIFGAMLGAAIADDDDGRRYPYARHNYRPYYAPPPVVMYGPPRYRYVAPPVYVTPRPMPYGWRHDRYDHRDGRWGRDDDRRHDGWGGRDGRDGRDGRGGRWDRDGDRRDDDRGGRR